MGGDTSVYTFAAPNGGIPVTITAELRFRRAFQAVMETRGWDSPDIVMEQTQAALVVQPWVDVFLPLVMRVP
jgi:hypothetical protein